MKTFIAAVAASLITASGFTIAQAGQPQAQSSATDRAAVSQLRSVNSKLSRLTTDADRTRDEIHKLRTDQSKSCRAIAEKFYECPTGF